MMNGDANSIMDEPMNPASSEEHPPDILKNVDCEENALKGINSDKPEHVDKMDIDDPLDDMNNGEEESLKNFEPPVQNPVTKDNSSPDEQHLNNRVSNSNSNDFCEDTVRDSHSDAESDSHSKNEMITDEKIPSKLDTLKIVAIEKHDSDNELGSDNSRESSRSDEHIKIEDTVTINFIPEIDNTNELHSNDTNVLDKSDDVIMLVQDNKEMINGKPKPHAEVHIIGSDNESNDCVMNTDVKSNENKKTEEAGKKKSPKKNSNVNSDSSSVQLRRSSRAITRKRYTDVEVVDDGSDVEEVVMEDPLKAKFTPIFIKNAKAFDMTPKPIKPKFNKDTVITIDSSPIKVKSCNMPFVKNQTKTNLNQNIYQKIMSRGTTVTPVSSKNMGIQVSQGTQATQTCIPPVLPTLTDDMFVVETPSFIVPYVYEKPSKIPFKDFVDKLGKEIEEEKAKEEQALKEKKKEEKAKRKQEREEKKQRGEEVQESEEEASPVTNNTTEPKKKGVKRERRRKKDDDDASWDGSSSSEESDDTISDDENTLAPKSVAGSLEHINDFSALTADSSGQNNSYFDLSLGKFFMNIGMNLVQEYVQSDLLKQQNRKLQREKKSGHSTTNRVLSIALLSKNLEMSQKQNESYVFKEKKCKLCSFRTESDIILANHMEAPHMKNNLYKCNFCEFEVRAPYDILHHMSSVHNVKGKLERVPAQFECSNCPFDVQGKKKLERHINACAKTFKPDRNLAPAVDLEFPAKITKFTKPRNNAAQVAQFGRNHVDGTYGKPIPVVSTPPTMYRPQNRAIPRPAGLPIQVRAAGIPIIPIRRFSPHVNNVTPNNGKKMNTGLSITPLPKLQTSTPMQNLSTLNTNAKGFVICEICDGYIKDLEQLRNHMQWIHKVKIHPKMIYNRPPLNCQKCQFRFFTDQGLERHLLGSHGLVTSSMQEAANKSKDAGRCPVCGRVYQCKLLHHVSSDHNMTLKPAHLSYKCTVCTATFGMYRLFECHVYSAHSVVAKKAIARQNPQQNNDLAAKQTSNNESSNIPQPVKVPVPTNK